MNEVNDASPANKVSGVERLVMWLNERKKKRIAKELYRKLWKANDILLYARHASILNNRYEKYHTELEHLADEIERVIVKVKSDT
jgi:hypothetical protein